MEHGIPPPSKLTPAERRVEDLVFDCLCRFESYRLHHFNLGLERHCMKKALFGLLFITTLAHADWRDPFEKFSTSKNFASSVVVTWQPVDDPTAACSAERARRVFESYSGKVAACSIYDGKTCLIITGRNTDRDTIGHELQHCFQGSWH